MKFVILLSIINIKRGFHPALLFVFLLLSPLVVAASGQTKKSTDKVDSVLYSMSLEQKIGQLFIFGFSGTKVSPNLKHLIKNSHVGSLIFFKHNIKTSRQVYNLTSGIQNYAKSNNELPLFLMIDQEGGVVSRIKTNPPPPSALSLGYSEDLKLTEKTGKITGEILKQLGFNFNLAPVADLSDPKQKNFIGSRSFGNSPDKVFDFTHAFSKGLLQSGVLPTFKHFPGHGNLKQDSHKTMPTKNISENTLILNDARPFKLLADKKTPAAVMSAHISFPQIDASEEPATYSKILLTEILKNKFKFNGLIMTDDLEMNGAKADMSVGERALKAFNAGADLLMVAWTPKEQQKAYKFLLSKARQGDLSLSRLDESLKKIIKYKLLVANQQSEYNKTKLKKLLVDLKNISTNVSFVNFKKHLNLNFTDNDFARFNTLIIYSSSNGFYRTLKSSTNFRSKFVKLKKGRRLNFKTLSGSTTVFGIFHVSGSGTARMLNKLPLSIKKKLIVVNSTYPGAIKNPKDFLGYTHTNTKNNKAAYWISKRLKKIKLNAKSPL